jgi:hypothetical protein
MITLPTKYEFEITVIKQAIEVIELIIQKNYKIYENYYNML